MKKSIIIASVLFALTTEVTAQVADGFYRVQNYGSQRYAYVCDNTGSINIANTSADMGAIVLRNASTHDRFSDPASVIYASKKGTNGSTTLYDLESQGTGVYGLINHYVGITNGNVAGTYWVYEASLNMYLWEGSRANAKDSYIDTNAIKRNNQPLLEYRCWSVLPVSATGEEYLGILPNTKNLLDGSYYQAYYLGFAMDFASTGMTAYYVSEVKDDAVIIEEIVGTVPAATPVIVKCSSAQTSDNRVELKATTPAAIKGNQLKGNYFCYADHGTTGYKEYDAETMRLLAVKDGKLQFIADTQHEYCQQLEFWEGFDVSYEWCLPANESYLVVPKGAAASLPVMTKEEYEASHASLPGDANGDGKVDIADVAVIYKQIGSGVSAVASPNSDVDKNGKIDIADIAIIYKNISSGK